MNERIRELAIEAGAGEWGDSVVPAMMDTQKFAELIILECVNVALEQKKRVEDQEVFNPHDEFWNRARIQQSQCIVAKINEHFAVEECTTNYVKQQKKNNQKHCDWLMI